MLSEQTEPNVVLRQQDRFDPRVHVRLVPPEPEHLRRGEAGERPVPGELDQPLEPDARLDLRTLRGGALIVPENRRPEHAVGSVERYEPVHLTRQPDCDGYDTQLLERSFCTSPPVLGVLLDPSRLRHRQRIRALGLRENAAVGGDGDSLDTGGADVEADERVACRRPHQAPSAAYTISYAATASFRDCASRSAASSIRLATPSM